MPRYFLTLEGIDGSGKSTAMRLVAGIAVSFGYSVVQTEEPTDRRIGRLIRDKLEGRSPMVPPLDLQKLFVEDRLDHVQNVIRPALNRGQFVISDRYWLSTLAYGMLSHPLEVWLTLHEDVFKGDFLKPDHAFVFDLPAETAIKRISGRGEGFDHFAKLEKLKQIRENYLVLAAQKLHPVSVIDATQLPIQIASAIWQTISRRF